FQAEDGIRDPLVTGVQTCALPICWLSIDCCMLRLFHQHIFWKDDMGSTSTSAGSRAESLPNDIRERLRPFYNGAPLCSGLQKARSEERRVGTMCRSWWWA